MHFNLEQKWLHYVYESLLTISTVRTKITEVALTAVFSFLFPARALIYNTRRITSGLKENEETLMITLMTLKLTFQLIKIRSYIISLTPCTSSKAKPKRRHGSKV